MTEQELIKRAIESANCRIYRVRANVGESLAHQVKADNQAEIMQVTIDALEKQIAKKPIVTVDEHTNLCWIRCSCCDTTIYWRYPKPFQYCVECGQKILDWGNEE